MNKIEYFNTICEGLRDKLQFLDDKPEENTESTVKALWLTAFGNPISAEKAMTLPLPELSEVQLKKLNELIQQRINKIPLAHITKRQSFLGIEFISDKRALIPRKETELLGKKAIELSVAMAKSKDEIKVIDVCCGSGNLGISISYFNPKCKTIAADISFEAVELAKQNVNLLDQNERVIVIQSDLFSGFESDEFYENADLIVCNPPYISSSKVVKMNSEIASYEPSLAFDGGIIGLQIIQKLIKEAPRFLKDGGWLVFEVGAGQGDFLYKLIEKNNAYEQIEALKDESGIIRVFNAKKSKSSLLQN